MQKEQKLGLKVFYYYLSRRILAGIVLLILSIIFLFLKETISTKILFFLSRENAIGISSLFITILFIGSLSFLVGGALLAWIKYISCTFTLSDVALSIKRGIFSKKEVSIPYRQIQNVNIEQSFVHRIMGICKLTIQTAGNENEKAGDAEGNFDIIDFNLAKETKEKLLQKTSLENTHQHTFEQVEKLENKIENNVEEITKEEKDSFTI